MLEMTTGGIVIGVFVAVLAVWVGRLVLAAFGGFKS